MKLPVSRPIREEAIVYSSGAAFLFALFVKIKNDAGFFTNAA